MRSLFIFILGIILAALGCSSKLTKVDRQLASTDHAAIFIPTEIKTQNLANFQKRVAELEVVESRDQFFNFAKYWHEKCTINLNCILMESDLYPGVKLSENRLIFFRGENAVYEFPAVSALVRNLLDSTLICDRPSEQLGQAAASPPLKCRNKHGTLLPVLSGASYDVENHFAISTVTDPFVSISRDPSIALSFAKSGRLFILAVPKSNFKILKSGADCNALYSNNYGDVLDLYACMNDVSPMHEENEANILYSTPPEYLLKVIRFSN